MADAETLFLGRGWSFPPTFSRVTYSVDMVSDDHDIQESLRILFATQMGERVMEPQYGTLLWQMVFQNINTTLLTQLEDMVRQAVLYWEARINVIDVSAQPDAAVAGLILINVSYIIRTTNARNNLVYPFYVNEATIPVGAA
jgi:phage baseplate assembly protein W